MDGGVTFIATAWFHFAVCISERAQSGRAAGRNENIEASSRGPSDDITSDVG